MLFVLLIGSANLINLLLIRANGRVKELAVRHLLGASRRHVVSQILTETTILALLGGLFGLAVAAGGIRLLETLGVGQLPLGSYVSFNGRVALPALMAAAVLGIVLALPVVWFSLSGWLANALQSESRASTTSRAAQRLRHSFSVAQIALAFVLVTGAGLLGISMKHLVETSPGFQTEQVVTGQLSLPWKKYQTNSDGFALMDRLVRAIQANSGVTAVGAFRSSSGLARQQLICSLFRFLDGPWVRRPALPFAVPRRADLAVRACKTE